MPLKRFDFVVIIPALVVTVASFLFVYSGRGTQYIIQLKSDSGEWVFPPDAVETVTAAGPLGETLVEIRGGTARVVSSPCVNQTCVAAGAVHLPGQWTACLPNRVLLYIASGTVIDESSSDVDAGAW